MGRLRSFPPCRCRFVKSRLARLAEHEENISLQLKIHDGSELSTGHIVAERSPEADLRVAARYEEEGPMVAGYQDSFLSSGDANNGWGSNDAAPGRGRSAFA